MRFTLFWITTGVLASTAASPRAAGPRHLPPAESGQALPNVAAGPEIRQRFGDLPMFFEPNAGQADSRVQFLARGPGYTLFLTGGDAVLVLRRAAGKVAPRFQGVYAHGARTGPVERIVRLFRSRIEEWTDARTGYPVLRLRLAGARGPVRAEGSGRLPGSSNYLTGGDPRRWRTHVPHYAKVQYRNVYPGIDVVYYGNQRQLEYDFVVQPGSDPQAIRLAFDGASLVRQDGAGDLLLEAGDAEVRLGKPVVYQNIGGRRKLVDARYELMETGFEARVAVSKYDPSLLAII